MSGPERLVNLLYSGAHLWRVEGYPAVSLKPTLIAAAGADTITTANNTFEAGYDLIIQL